MNKTLLEIFEENNLLDKIGFTKKECRFSYLLKLASSRIDLDNEMLLESIKILMKEHSYLIIQEINHLL